MWAGKKNSMEMTEMLLCMGCGVSAYLASVTLTNSASCKNFAYLLVRLQLEKACGPLFFSEDPPVAWNRAA